MRLWLLRKGKAVETSPQTKEQPDTEGFDLRIPGEFKDQRVDVGPDFNPAAIWDKEAKHRAKRIKSDKTTA